jgi:hypothetical protein
MSSFNIQLCDRKVAMSHRYTLTLWRSRDIASVKSLFEQRDREDEITEDQINRQAVVVLLKTIDIAMGWFAKKLEGKRSSNTADEPLTTTVGNYLLAQENAIVPTTPASVKKEYIAPSPVASSLASPSQASVPTKSPVSQALSKAEEEDMVVVEAPIENCMTEDGYGDIENPVSTSFSKGVESEHEPRHESHSNSKQSHLNSLFNGHLMKWKFEAEEGTAFIRVPACKYRSA